MKIIKGDKIKIVSGKDKGKIASVVKVLSSVNKIVAEDVNMLKKHMRAKKEGQKGQVVRIAMPFNVSNAMLVCPKCGKITRVGRKILGTGKGKSVRICKKCEAEI